MPTDIVMPQMGESITEGTITKWLKKPGDSVQRDEPLFEISTDKVDAEIPSPVAGTLKEIKIAEGTTVQINTVVAVIDGADSAAAAPAPAAPAPAASAPAKTEASTAPVVPEKAKPAPAAGPGTDVLMPQMGESITEGTITKWLKKVGDSVQRDEPIFEISTDKVDAEIPSPVAGTLTEIKVPEGATVTINTVVAVIGGGAAKPAAAPAPVVAAPAAAPAPVAAAAPARTEGERLRSSPLVRKIAKENNVDLGAVAGTGASGRITKADILGHLEGGAKPSAAPAVAPAAVAVAPAAKPAAPAQPLPGELVQMSKMRVIIAERMVESKHTSPHVHTVFKVDMTRIVRLREKEKAKYEQRNGVKLTYMPFITRAAIAALRKHPIVNGSIEGTAIRYNKNINVGIAVALDWGLIVPVIKQAEEKNFLGITRAIVDIADRARGKKLAPDEISGGTFTLTNSGIFGEQFGMPIINQPQSAILGIGGLNKEAVVLTDKDGSDSIAIRSIQRFTLGFDHRIIDGADAGKFMSDFKAYLENWSEDIG
ncbi:2-oxoglutarate dehydrogenase, E2 component, dihydrolipoamide succinyltransferase [Edaphobacter sp.]|uniref:2-oxoglutarate dehydrogenase, E2 component, dihydrolipoamide succinyltransferase n=1 Tax=Edaphobacter sp. TaxID=1934404 RepID=UPI002DB5B484|nr:2-oxoglutarate dehydrogenase, E2 component, dihydrolipoamide succinyltransferase [Edaphobacter sp.]HEU5342134.1 2-oxoglutarate dehydrogenase, E2 component, dihydrolipoamide succinyltransferase [Edaphobacter sp.]